MQTQLGLPDMVISCCDPRGTLDGDTQTDHFLDSGGSPLDGRESPNPHQTRARSQSRRRKHVLSLMTECQDCPCWGKEACQGVLHFTDNHIRHGRPPLSD